MKREDYTCRSGQPQAVDQTCGMGVLAREITRKMRVPRKPTHYLQTFLMC